MVNQQARITDLMTGLGYCYCAYYVMEICDGIRSTDK